MSYASLAEARAEGITTGQASDVRLQALLDGASEFIDDRTGWWFDARAKTLRLDGPGTEHLHLPAPVVSLTSVTLDGVSLSIVDGDQPADVIVYGALTDPMAERRNPKLVRRPLERIARLYPGTVPVPWTRGRKNLVVIGSFGMTAESGTAPPREIKEACIRLAVRALALLSNSAGQAARWMGDVTKETTDGHAYELGALAAGGVGSWRRNGWTGDPDIDTTLMRWSRGPAGAVAGGSV